MKTKGGGPAFPLCGSIVKQYQPTGIVTGESLQGFQSGMSLRDYFAAKAMQSYIITVADKNSDDYEVEREIGKDDGESAEYHISKWAYIIADAMLEAREK